jgi:lipopolysaccharide/colanic/teichoic acid biosynthesis glycosyltransferase
MTASRRPSEGQTGAVEEDGRTYPAGLEREEAGRSPHGVTQVRRLRPTPDGRILDGAARRGLDGLEAEGDVGSAAKIRTCPRGARGEPTGVEAAAFGSKGVPAWLRAFEIAASACALIVTAPLMLFIAVAIRRGTPGPAIFKHQRLTVNAKPFTFYKFRTHYVDSHDRFPELCAYSFDQREVDMVRLQEEGDPRVTPQGQWLRLTSLDELPNFWNVLRGDMGLVGPRPEMVEMLPYYTGENLRKFSVRPGITGLAQISGRGKLTFAETLKCDLEYVGNHSLKKDVEIVLKTIKMALNREGAY